MADKQIVTVECGADGYEDCWIEFDVTDWGVYQWRVIPNGDLTEQIPNWVEPYSVDWLVKDRNGKPIKHPGQAAPEEKWLAAYERMGPGLAFWLSISPQNALWQAMTPTKKSDAGGKKGGD